MRNFISNFIEKKRTNSFFAIFFTILGVIIVRTFLENFSSPTYDGFYSSAYAAFLHYPIFFISIFLSLNILLYFFTKTKISDLFNFSILFFPIIWLPPIIDLFFVQDPSIKMGYIMQPVHEVWKNFVTIFGGEGASGVTTGIRVEFFAIMLGILAFIWQKTKNVYKTIGGIIFGYIIFFIYAIIPSLAIVGQCSDKSLPTLACLMNVTKGSLLGRILPDQGGAQIQILLGRFFWILVAVQVLFLFSKYESRLWNAWKHNLRWERVVYYSFIGFFGFFIVQKTGNATMIFNVPDILSIMMFFMIVAFNCWLAVLVNDHYDKKIDKVSNAERPFIQESIHSHEAAAIGLTLATLILTGAVLLNYQTFVMLLAFQVLYFLYSSPPLHLKRNFVFSSAILGLTALVVAMAGFFLVSRSQQWAAFSMKYVWLIFTSFALWGNAKDIKDHEGDKQENIKTLPVIFGLSKGKKIISLLCALALLVQLFFFKILILLPISISFILAAYFLINREPYKEKYVFYLFFLYMVIVFTVT